MKVMNFISTFIPILSSLIPLLEILLPSMSVGLVHPNSIFIHYTMNRVFFSRKSNYSTIQISNIPEVWFLENLVVKNWADVVLHHMLDRKRKNITLPYDKLITKIITYTGYEFG